MTGRTWLCDAYGDKLPDGCFFDAIQSCPDHATCASRMDAERKRVFDRIQELAAEGNPTGEYLAGEFTAAGPAAERTGGRRMTAPTPHIPDELHDRLVDEILDELRAPNESRVDDACGVLRAVMETLAIAGYQVVKDDGADHIIEFGAAGWTIKHPLSCRPNLFECPVNRAAEQQVTGEPASGFGRYIAVLDRNGLLCIEALPVDDVPCDASCLDVHGQKAPNVD